MRAIELMGKAVCTDFREAGQLGLWSVSEAPSPGGARLGPAYPEPWRQWLHLNLPGLAGGRMLDVSCPLHAASPGLRTVGPVMMSHCPFVELVKSELCGYLCVASEHTSHSILKDDGLVFLRSQSMTPALLYVVYLNCGFSLPQGHCVGIDGKELR